MTSGSKARRVFITGGTGSIGQVLVKRFCERGDDVTFQFFSNNKVARDLEKEYGAQPIQIDCTKESKLPDVKFHVVINNAAINVSRKLAHEVSRDDWNRTIAVNISFPFLVIKKYLPLMIEERWGRIINISSIYGLRGATRNLPYNVTKHGLSGLTKTVAIEAAEFKVTCNEICPGPVESELVTRIANDNKKSTGQDVGEFFKEISDEIPAKRMAFPIEIADLAVFVSSEEAAYLNGVSIPLDGGLIA